MANWFRCQQKITDFRTIVQFFRGFFGKIAAKIVIFLQYPESVDQSKAAKMVNRRENPTFFTKIAKFRENRQKFCR